MIEETPQTDSQRGMTDTLKAALVLLVCLVAAAVALTYSGMDPAAIVGLLAGIAGVGATMVGLLGRLASLHQETAQQTQVIQKIDHQTNGVLEERMRRVVDDALNGPIGYVPTHSDEEEAA
jgi:hypothetical protein